MSRVIIAGSRDLWPDVAAIQCIVEASGFIVTELVNGGAQGVDACAIRWAWSKPGLPVTPFEAEWHLHGRRAGPRRNERMAQYGEKLIAIYRGPGRPTPGTANMIKRARYHDLPVFEFVISAGSGL